MKNKNLKQIKSSCILLVIYISFISFCSPAFAESQQCYYSNFHQIQKQYQENQNSGTKRGRPKRRKPMGNRLYAVNS